MPDPTCDVQLEALAGVIQARLVGARVGSCASVVLYAPPYKEAATRCPMLYAYRASEKLERWGTAAKIGRTASVRLLYVLGPTGGQRLEAAAYLLSWAVQMITDAIISAADAGYESGAKLETLAAIEELTIDAVEYNLDLEMPQVEFTVRMRHKWTRTPADSVPLEEIRGSLNMNVELDPVSWPYAPGLLLTITPRVLGASLVIESGAAFAVVVDVNAEGQPEIAATAVVGSTKLSDLAAAIAGDITAAALMVVSGDEGILLAAPSPPVVYAPSRAITRQVSETD